MHAVCIKALFLKNWYCGAYTWKTEKGRSWVERQTELHIASCQEEADRQK